MSEKLPSFLHVPKYSPLVNKTEYHDLDKTIFIIIYYPSHLTLKLNAKDRHILDLDTGNKTDDHKTLIH